LVIYDVGNRVRRGTPSNPVKISRIAPTAAGPNAPCPRSGWWFHNPLTHEARYLFIAEAGADNSGVPYAAGSLQVIDVSSLEAPRQVARLELHGGPGIRTLWVDEPRQVLYAVSIDVVAVDVSGVLAGDLTSRVLRRAVPGDEPRSFVSAVQAANGALWAIDMITGFWKLDPRTLSPIGAHDPRLKEGSGLWVAGQYAYMGRWSGRYFDGSTSLPPAMRSTCGRCPGRIPYWSTRSSWPESVPYPTSR